MARSLKGFRSEMGGAEEDVEENFGGKKNISIFLGMLRCHSEATRIINFKGWIEINSVVFFSGRKYLKRFWDI